MLSNEELERLPQNVVFRLLFRAKSYQNHTANGFGRNGLTIVPKGFLDLISVQCKAMESRQNCSIMLKDRHSLGRSKRRCLLCSLRNTLDFSLQQETRVAAQVQEALKS
eukprot:2657808-Amphidinium_carterae.1